MARPGLFSSHRWLVLALVLHFATRLPFLLDDPAPELLTYYQDAATSVFDEGWWTANARHWVLEKHLLGTGFDLFWVSPVFSLFAAVAFTLGGVSYATGRLLTIVIGAVALTLLARSDRRSKRASAPPTAGEWAALLCAGSFALAQTGRLATPEWVGIFFGVLGAVSLLRKTGWGFAAAGACAVLAALSKPHFAFLGPAFVLSAAALAFREGQPVWPAIFRVIAGAALPALLWCAVVFAHPEEAFGLMRFYQHDRWFAGAAAGGGVIGLIKPLFQVILSGVIYRHLFFSSLPAVFLLAALALPRAAAALGKLRDRDRLTDAEVVNTIWALVGVCAISAIPFQPLRYYLPVMPAVTYLAGMSLVRWIEPGNTAPRPGKPRPERILGWVVAAFLFVQIMYAALAWRLVPALVNRAQGGHVELLQPPSFSITSFLVEIARTRSLDAFVSLPHEIALVAAAALAALEALGAGLLLAVLGGRFLSRVAGLLQSRTAFIVFAALALAFETHSWATWLPRRARTLHEMSLDLGARFATRDVLVSPAGNFSLDNKLRYDSAVVREYKMFDGDGPATHFVVLESHPQIGVLPEGTIERMFPTTRRLAGYTLTGDYVYGLYERAGDGKAENGGGP